MNISKGMRLKHYEILSPLGAGGMGQVYLAEDTQLRRKVAIKILPPGSAGNEVAEKRLLREARAAATLDHPNICAIYEVGEEGDCKFIVLQYIEGKTLAEQLRSGPLELHKALSIAAKIADGLAEAHERGIIHRDIKPENVMITTRGQVKVLDFGLAKVTPDQAAEQSAVETESQLSIAGLVMGTLPYMSPEQVRGEELDCRTDIFSFGAMLYELLNGRRPFEARSKAEIISAILTQEPPPLQCSSSPEIERLVRKCMEKDPENRYKTTGDLVVELENIRQRLQSGSANTNAEGAIRSNSSFAGLSYSRLKKVIAVIVILALFGILWTLLSNRNRTTVIPADDSNAQNSPAYDYYVRGKVKVNSENRESNEGAIALLEKAVAQDPRFAPAYAELARAYNVKAFLYASQTERKQLIENAEVAVQKALALDPNLAEAHYARGRILWTHAKGFPHELAIQSYKRALSLNPGLDDAHRQLGMVYTHIGLLDKARSEFETALKINPNNTSARFHSGTIDLYSGRYEDAISVLKGIPQDVNPAGRDRAMATALLGSGKIDESMAVVNDFLKTYPTDEGGNVTSVKAMLLARTGKQQEAEQAIQRAAEIGKGFGHFHHTAYNIASAYALLGKSDEAIQWLQSAADDGFPCYPLFEKDPNLHSLRQEDRFIAFMESLKKQWERYKATL